MSKSNDLHRCVSASTIISLQPLGTNVYRHRLSTIMNADRIIVVENGQIVEQGSHNNLIVSGGRYADLWSKQIFVRPKDDDDNAPNDKKDGAIVNDLSSEQTKAELSKVKPTPPTTDSVAASDDNKGDATSTPWHSHDVSIGIKIDTCI